MSSSPLLPALRASVWVGTLVLSTLMSWASVAEAEGPAGASFRAYPCAAGAVETLAGQLKQQFGGDARIKVVPDRQRSQVLVLAPPEVQAQIAAQVPGAPAATPTRPGAASRPAAPATIPVARQEVPLRQVSAAEMEVALVRALGARLSPLPEAQPGSSCYQLRLPGGNSLRLILDSSGNRVLLDGNSAAVQPAMQLIAALDASPRGAQANTEIVSVQGPTAVAVQPVMEVLRSQQPRGEEAAAASSPALRVVSGMIAAQPGSPAGAEVSADALGALGQVKLEVLEGLDVLVIRGDQKDVQRVVQIIEQIEQLAQETKPAVDVVQLQHVDSVALGNLLTQVYKDIFSARTGTISITPLGKPNALLLVGNAETITMVRELIQRLDQPVAPLAQMQLFHLKAIPAEAAQKSVEDYFKQQEGNNRSNSDSQTDTGSLAPRVTVVADFRTNALIVRANPRELAEVAALLARIDGGTTEAVNDIRVYRLKNCMATKMAEVLRDAITGPIYGQQSQQGSNGAPNSGQNNTSPLKSTRLQFVTLDPQKRQVLRSGILTDTQITADARTNSIIVTASPDSLPLIEALIHELDQPPELETLVKVFTLVNGDATSMQKMLQSVFGQASNSSDSAAVQTGTPIDETTLVGLQFAVDTRTNSVIVTGSSGALTVVEAVIMRLEGSELRTRRTIVYRLKNSPAADVAEAINGYLTKEREVDTTSITQTAVTAYEQIQKEVIIMPEPVSNSLIVSATPRFFDEIAKIVRDLDQRPPMVMIQVLIGEVSLGTTKEFGVELGLQDSVLFDRSAISGTAPNTALSPGYAFNGAALGNSANGIANSSKVGSQGITNLNVGRTNSDLGFGGLVLSASSESVSVLIRALQQQQRIQVLSRPQVMTLDAQTAMIHVGQDVPTITGSSTTQYGGIINAIEPRSVGLILNVTPRISPDRLVVMEVQAEKSKVGDTDDGIPVAVTEGQVIKSPKIDITNTRTVVSVMDGQTVVLGGLIETNDKHVERRVPYLSDIPLLGKLFQYQYDTKERAELLFILTPHIVFSEEEAEAIKRMEMARMHWCLCDVMQLHDGDGLAKNGPTWYDGKAAVIYPDLDPTLKTMQELAPPSDGVKAPTAPETIPTPNATPEPMMPQVQQPQLAPPQATPPQSLQMPPMHPISAAPAARNPIAQTTLPRANGAGAAPQAAGMPGMAQPVIYNAPMTPTVGQEPANRNGMPSMAQPASFQAPIASAAPNQMPGTTQPLPPIYQTVPPQVSWPANETTPNGYQNPGYPYATVPQGPSVAR